jgi:hypothetical protein
MLDQGLDRDALQDSGELELLIVRIGNPRIQLNFGFGFADGQLEQTLVTTRNAVCQPTTSKPLSPTHSPYGHTRTAERCKKTKFHYIGRQSDSAKFADRDFMSGEMPKTSFMSLTSEGRPRAKLPRAADRSRARSC